MALGPRAAAVMEQARLVLHVGQLLARSKYFQVRSYIQLTIIVFLSNAPTMVEDISCMEAAD